MIGKLLVANRGEVAVRILRACRRLGIRTVAVYSEADRRALHVELADEACLLGAPEPRASYLDAGKIIACAARVGAEAIHPGYGFLAENADFSRRCEEAGLIFVGPRTEAIALMGSKTESRRLAQRLGVPVVPGYDGNEQDAQTLRQAAREIGFPLLIKASAGGGGKGIRLVAGIEEFDSILALARQEAAAAFGDDRVILERSIAEPRHIEVQVVGDRHGKLVHLFERECSLQRRHQKLIEEAPAPALPEEARAALHAHALRLAAAVGYDSLGTVEFLYDNATGHPHFLEMNTRLQVEHPVTELVTGLDLVELQIRIAAGEPLPFTQNEVRLRGHAIEARVCAEDPAREFAPELGVIGAYREPKGEGVRVDSGVRQGSEVSPYYDSLLAKAICHGASRKLALRRLHAALGKFEIAGLRTNLSFLRSLLGHPAFAAGELTTHFIPRHFPSQSGAHAEAGRLELAAAAIGWLAALEAARAGQADVSPWETLGAWRVIAQAGYAGYTEVAFTSGGAPAGVVRVMGGGERWRVGVCGEWMEVHAWRENHDVLAMEIDAIAYKFGVSVCGDEITVSSGAGRHLFQRLPREAQHGRRILEEGGQAVRHLVAQLPGVVVEVLVQTGERVTQGQVLVTMEAMKMVHRLTADVEAVVEAVRCKPGVTVKTGAVLLDLGDPKD